GARSDRVSTCKMFEIADNYPVATAPGTDLILRMALLSQPASES
ncbi:MAG: hypothetical protein QOF63_4347, partial [Thermoanaerobaculia bacterium]|nr:hypothetical protein [Thermoanaerobaculia bacterium]